MVDRIGSCPQQFERWEELREGVFGEISQPTKVDAENRGRLIADQAKMTIVTIQARLK
jgi:hypothetical protein